MKEAQSIVGILRTVGAILTDDHFVLTSGKHSDIYINKDALYPHTQQTSQVGELFAQKAKDLAVDVVVGPALGGIILSQWTAYHLSVLSGKEVLGVYAEKGPEKTFMLTRGYDALVRGKRVLVVEDLTSTGGSVKRVVDAVMACGGTVVSVGVMLNRDPEHVTSEVMGVPFFALGELVVKAYEESDLPVEIAKRPINTKIGHGKKYLAMKESSQ